MSKQYRLVVFDWEGTLGDTLGQVLHCMASEAKRLNYGELDEALVRQSVELGLAHAIKRLFPSLSSIEQEQLLKAIQHALINRSHEVYLIPGAREFVQQLHQAGINLAIASNKGQNSLNRAIQSSGLDEFFKVVCSAGQMPPKPCPQMLEEILLAFNIDVNQAVMIGDSVSDIEMARTIGMDAIGVNFYNQQHSNLLLEKGALAVFDNYPQLAIYLNVAAS
ncbi:hydrolase (haloacid dehalogenase family) [Legionella beliardensis]|uniref:Hydrolase (Haloacid dehalogenase family) n=1 Tax=Legionella beliardensis TaxID=91822 RepID=A0A378I443_9GAMM|nr:HAD family hydrolase [Legionella beliardensis]STX29622.1 hydrolase (haloacid dehalogenase family) [Legionella beliardensis]